MSRIRKIEDCNQYEISTRDFNSILSHDCCDNWNMTDPFDSRFSISLNTSHRGKAIKKARQIVDNSQEKLENHMLKYSHC